MKTLITLTLCLLFLTAAPAATLRGVGYDSTTKALAPVNLLKSNATTIAAVLGTNLTQHSVQEFGAVGNGTTDDTGAFQTALNLGGTILVPYTSGGYLVTNLIATNNSTLRGVGGRPRLIFRPNATGHLLEATNFQRNVSIERLEFDGTNNSTFIAGASGSRSGIGLSSYGTAQRVIDCFVHGFDSNGIVVWGNNNASSSALTAGTNNAAVRDSEVHWCHIGVNVADSVAEYTEIRGVTVIGCRKGLYIGSGNALVVGCRALLSDVGLWIYGASNDGHGSASGCQFNHNNFPIFCDTVGTGFLIDGCQIWQGTLVLSNSAAVVVRNCQGSLTGFTGTGSTRCRFGDNVLWTTYGNTLTQSGGDTTVIENNYDQNGTIVGTYGLKRPGVGVMQAGLSTSNVFLSGQIFVSTASFTNLNAAPATLTNLGAVSIPGNCLTNTGDRIVAKWGGRDAGSLPNTNNFQIVYGSQTILDTGLQVSSNFTFNAWVEISRTGSTAQHAEAHFEWNANTGVTGLPWTSTNVNVELVQTNGIATTIALKGSAQRVGAHTNNSFQVQFQPGPQ